MIQVKQKSIIEIFEKNGRVYGKIVKIFTTQDADPIVMNTLKMIQDLQKDHRKGDHQNMQKDCDEYS